MSYDLFLRPRSGALEPQRFFEWFRQRIGYKVEGRQAWYENEDTGVYFVFENPVEPDPGDYPFLFNINFFRPSFFVREAEPEVSAVVRQFDLVVSDPQIEGMGEGDFSPALLATGWDHGNRAAYAAFLKQGNPTGPIRSLPAARLEGAWSWNRERSSRQESLGDGQFVPRIMFLEREGRVVTAVAWPDAISSVLPRVDYLIVGRTELAPRKLLRRKKDMVWIAWEEIQPVLSRHGVALGDGFDLAYAEPPEEIARFVRECDRPLPEATSIAPGEVLERELVDLAAARLTRH